MTIHPRSHVATLALLAVLVVGACSGGATASAPPGASEPVPGESATAGGPPECLSFADIYALLGPESENVTTWDQAAAIAGELGSSTEFPGVVVLGLPG